MIMLCCVYNFKAHHKHTLKLKFYIRQWNISCLWQLIAIIKWLLIDNSGAEECAWNSLPLCFVFGSINQKVLFVQIEDIYWLSVVVFVVAVSSQSTEIVKNLHLKWPNFLEQRFMPALRNYFIPAASNNLGILGTEQRWRDSPLNTSNSTRNGWTAKTLRHRFTGFQEKWNGDEIDLQAKCN